MREIYVESQKKNIIIYPPNREVGVEKKITENRTGNESNGTTPFPLT